MATASSGTNPSAPGPGPAPAPLAPPKPSGPGFRARWTRYLLSAAAACLLLVSLLHAGGYAVASIAVANSGLKPEYQAMFRGLWMGFSVQALVVAAILAISAFRPNAVSRPAMVLCGLLPMIGGAMVAWSLASPVASVLLIGASLLVVAGALLRPSATPS